MEYSRNIGLVCSVDQECGKIMSEMRDIKYLHTGPVTLLSGSIGRKKVILVITGIGKVNASHGATILTGEYRPSCVINFGIGGCYPASGLSIGDVAVASKEFYADEGVIMGDRFFSMEEAGMAILQIGRKRYYNEFHPGAALMRIFRKKVAGMPINTGYGIFLTVSSVSGTIRRSEYLERSFGGVCENMEGAAVFHVAHMYKTACFEVRGISNIAGIRDKRKWNFRKAAENCQAVLLEFIGGL